MTRKALFATHQKAVAITMPSEYTPEVWSHDQRVRAVRSGVGHSAVFAQWHARGMAFYLGEVSPPPPPPRSRVATPSLRPTELSTGARSWVAREGESQNRRTGSSKSGGGASRQDGTSDPPMQREQSIGLSSVGAIPIEEEEDAGGEEEDESGQGATGESAGAGGDGGSCLPPPLSLPAAPPSNSASHEASFWPDRSSRERVRRKGHGHRRGDTLCDWEEAKFCFEQASATHPDGVDHPSQSIIGFMAKYNYVAPPWFKGFRNNYV